MPPQERFVPRFLAEPPQEGIPYGRWAQRLEQEMLRAWRELDGEGEDLGEPGEIIWYPDRTWHGRRYVPASTITSAGFELYGYVRFVTGHSEDDPIEMLARGDFTDQTASRNAGWKLDLCEEVIGSWRGQNGNVAQVTLIWGRPLVGSGRIVTAELGDECVDQCELIEGRFTLIAPDDYLYDLLEIHLWGVRGQELARESLYEQDDASTGTEPDVSSTG